MSYSMSVPNNAFMSKVMMMLALTMLPTIAGLFVGIKMIATIAAMGVWFPILFFVVLMGFVFLLSSMKDSPLGFLLLFVFTFFMGFVMSSSIAYYLASPGGVELIIKAFAITIIIFFAMGFIGMTTKKDLSGMGSVLFVILIGLIIAAIVNIFIGSTILSFITSAISAIVFSLFIMYDINRICNGFETSVIRATLNLYLDFINLFMSLLNILGLSKD